MSRKELEADYEELKKDYYDNYKKHSRIINDLQRENQKLKKENAELKKNMEENKTEKVSELKTLKMKEKEAAAAEYFGFSWGDYMNSVVRKVIIKTYDALSKLEGNEND